MPSRDPSGSKSPGAHQAGGNHNDTERNTQGTAKLESPRSSRPIIRMDFQVSLSPRESPWPWRKRMPLREFLSFR